jgi:hypothetical protein
MLADMTPEPTSNVPSDRRIPSVTPELESMRLVRPAPGRPATLLVALFGVGALWACFRPRPARKAKDLPDMPTLAGRRGLPPDPGHRSVVHRESPAAALPRTRGLPDVERQDGRLHEGRPRSSRVTPSPDRRTRPGRHSVTPTRGRFARPR